MHNKITMEMSICQVGNGFSLDELVKKLADTFEKSEQELPPLRKSMNPAAGNSVRGAS